MLGSGEKEMTEHLFAAFAVGGELDLSRIGSHLGLIRKYRWEEPLLLNPATFKPIPGDRSAQQQVYLFYFGGVVFVNCSDDTIRDFFRGVAKITEQVNGFPDINYQERYSLRVESGGAPSITNDCAVMPRYDRAFIDIIAFVIAKSVALERIEEQVDKVLDEMEGLITLLDRGELGIPDKRLAKLASKILNFTFRSLSHIMILDKPDITWDSAEADRLYSTLANLFELNQRYNQIKHKSDTLLNINEVLTGLSHARRSARLEWIIIILIAVEIVLFLWEMVRR
jgi:uncharacterized Rmd1/YagE family protein